MSQLHVIPDAQDLMTSSQGRQLSLEEENIHLRRQVKTLEVEKEYLQAFLGQRIELLEAQVVSFNDREESLKRINQTIMQALEEMNHKESTDVLKIKAIEELEKVTQQYDQTLQHLKARMKDEAIRLEVENKSLKENLLEKEYELKALKALLGEMKTGFVSINDFGVKSTRTLSPNEEIDGMWDRIQTSPSYSVGNTAWTRGFKTEKYYEGRGDLLKTQPVMSEKENIESIRSKGQLPEGGIRLSGGNEEFGIRNKMEYYWRELAKRKSNGEVSDRFFSYNQTAPQKGLSMNHLMHHELSLSKITTPTGRTYIESLNEQKFQKPNHLSSSASNLLTIDINKTNTTHYNTPWEAPEPIIIEERIYSHDDEDVREQVWSNGVTEVKRKSTEQVFCPPRNTEGFTGVHDLENLEGQERTSIKKAHKFNKADKLLKYKQYAKICFENVNDVLKETETNTETNNNWRNEMKGDNRKNVVQRQNSVEKVHSKAEEENVDIKTETKYMIGRLLKVKDKVEKQDSDTTASRKGLGWSNSQLYSYYSNSGADQEENIKEGKKTGKFPNPHDLQEKGNGDRRQKNQGTTKTTAIKGFNVGKKEGVQSRKLVR